MSSAVARLDASEVPLKKHPWYGIRTRSHHEKRVSDILYRKGYEQYLPLYRVRRKWTDRVKVSEEPLFPGYLFSRFEAHERAAIVSTLGVVEVVQFGSEPAPIDDEEIEAVRQVLKSGLPVQPCQFLQEGQRVRILCGALKDIEGILVKQKSEYRLVISVTTLYRSVSVEIDRDLIAAIS